MSLYAAGTKVSAQKSRNEIETTLERYGATQFGLAVEQQRAVVMFVADGRQVRFVIPMPDADDRVVTHTPTGLRRDRAQIQSALEAEARRRWRALALAIKAKMEVVASGIATFEEEFAAHVVLPDGSTVGEWLQPQIEAAYTSGAMPSSLLALPSGGA